MTSSVYTRDVQKSPLFHIFVGDAEGRTVVLLELKNSVADPVDLTPTRTVLFVIVMIYSPLRVLSHLVPPKSSFPCCLEHTKLH